MIIAYDVSHFRQQRAGIGRLAVMQLQGLLAADRQHTYLLHGWAPDLDVEMIESLVTPNARLSIAKIPGIVKRMYWNYLRVPPIQTFLGRFDVFHGAEPLLPPIGKGKAIISFNDSAYYKFPHFYNKATARKWNYLYRRSLRRADAVTVLSGNTRADLIEMMDMPAEKVHVVRPPTDPVFTNIRSPLDENRVREKFHLTTPFILFVGTLEPRKNIPRLVKAFELFQKSISDTVSLVIVGRRGWMYEDILAAVNTSSVRDRIHLLNYVADEDLAALYRMAMMFVFPSLYEGHGYPVVEAMASGTPVITANNSSLKEIGEGAALLVDAESTAEIGNAIQLLHRNEELRRELALKGLARAKRFSVENAVDAILKVYDTLEK
ncbi:MAG: glycosyltransferase family 4 protein [Bacteroidetes bacterium]|nr:glycosyltransferase family 4 protein [Bacteroidota bacterium]MCW5895855.1 glycosyltransferase family 4 protein [Bacteroidota bacterium]